MRSTFARLGLIAVAWFVVAAVAHAVDEPKKAEEPLADPAAIEVHFSDGSVLKMTVQEDSFEITTSAGKKTVKLSEVRKIRLTPRLDDADKKKIDAAIKDLGSDAFKDRQRAMIELIRFGIKAYPALVVASEKGDAETRKRAGEIIETFKQTLPEEMFDIPTEDSLWTREGKLVGKISQTSWKAKTTQFGEVQVKIGDVRQVRWTGYPDPEGEKLVAQDDPGDVEELAGQIGKVFAFKVTGTADGCVWGTGTYTSDSTISTAAVHAGLLKVGQKGVVKLRIVKPLNGYTGSTKNGITTEGYGPWDGAYEFVK